MTLRDDMSLEEAQSAATRYWPGARIDLAPLGPTPLCCLTVPTAEGGRLFYFASNLVGCIDQAMAAELRRMNTAAASRSKLDPKAAQAAIERANLLLGKPQQQYVYAVFQGTRTDAFILRAFRSVYAAKEFGRQRGGVTKWKEHDSHGRSWSSVSGSKEEQLVIVETPLEAD